MGDGGGASLGQLRAQVKPQWRPVTSGGSGKSLMTGFGISGAGLKKFTVRIVLCVYPRNQQILLLRDNSLFECLF